MIREGQPMKRSRVEKINVSEANPPNDLSSDQSLGTVQGWLSDDDPFLTEIDQIVSARVDRRSRTLRKPSKDGKQ
jgi:hypothetical protein